ncbi:SDR family NAD(P)-dependent oxidoreductase [Allorhizobium sp. BGMRC 0089]|uniref:type I polyketide synthase n=1 Tax=Allorhizobium sonneratiae TaxID=2934936 RepID=UPI0020335274|nr:type I polyketide synthase [Allorhizobium sonneratiae]MCM2294362.1 SDR family NAD(P)-dependent oxidoreductase [Allorhizobium sonneratiae]
MAVEIIGRACVAPGANSTDELFSVLSQGRCTVTTLPQDRWDIARYWHPEIGIAGKYYTLAAGVLDDIYCFDPALFGMSQREAAFMDPQQRILLELTWRALEDANIPAESLHGENVAVYVGASSLDHANLAAEDPAGPGPHFMTGNTLSVVSNRISHVFGLNGPSLTVDTACSSSLVALDHAVRAIEAGLVDTAIVAGVNVLVHPLPFVGFAQARMLSIDGLCKAYSNDGIGYVRAEGAVSLVLRSRDRALREGDRSHATILASGINAAGRTNGISLPSKEAQATLLRAVYDGNGIDPDSLAFIEGHGTGTKVGDPAEVWSLGTVIGQRRKEPILIGSIKTNIGHAEPASGLLGLMKAMLALEHDLLPPSLHFDEPNDAIDFEGLNVKVAAQPVPLPRGKTARRAGVNSFGFGGANAHVVIADPEPVSRLAPASSHEPVFMISAHTQESLTALVEAYDAAFRTDPQAAAGIISAAAANRAALKHRFVASGPTEAVIRAVAERRETGKSGGEIGTALTLNAKLAFVFAGNGAQWAGMGLDAYRANPVFRQSFDHVAASFSRFSPISLKDALTDPALEARLKDTRLAQPLLFAVQVALTDALKAKGLTPDAVFGHSVGEVAAAYCAGALTLDDAVAVIAKRSQHQAVLAGSGTMAALKLGEADAAVLIGELALDDVAIAAINALGSVTVSGPREAVQAVRDEARKRRIPAQVLDIDYPFHHPLIDMAQDGFFADPPVIAPRPAVLPFISTVTGEVFDGQALTADYWWQNVRCPVRFRQATETALALECSVFVEISPRAILGNYVGETAQHAGQSVTTIATLNRDQAPDGIDPVAQALARAIAHGARVDASAVFGPRRAEIRLPGLPFSHLELRPEPTSDRVDLYGRFARNAYRLNGWRVDMNGTHWKNHVDARLFPDLGEHVVDGRAILPGSGFIEIALSAGQDLFGTDRLELANLDILRPLELSDSHILELSTEISRETGDIRILSRERLSEDDWTLHAMGRLRRLTATEAPATVLNDLPAPTAVVDAESAYRTARHFGLDYGPHFQLLERAVCHGDHWLEVVLKPAASPAHPLLGYNLNPMSVDAMFHGLVALFDRLSGERGGAPYIPVGFAMIRTACLGLAVHRAVIEIERVSESSIKAHFTLFAEDGSLIASLRGGRFRRTYLKQHKPLESLAYRYETVALPLLRDSELFLPPGLFADGDVEPDTASVLLQAAVLSALHGLALRLADPDVCVRSGRLPAERQLRRFLVNGLHLLSDAGLAVAEDGCWRLEPDAGLPPVSELIGELYRDFPARTVELVMINDVYSALDARLQAVDGGLNGADLWSGLVGEATLEHFAVHSPLASARMERLLDAANSLIGDDSPVSAPFWLELGAVSVHFSRKLAALIRARGGRLVICEPDAGLRRNLELAFEADAAVQVVDRKGLDGMTFIDTVVSAAADLASLIDGDMLARFTHGSLLSVRRFIAVASAPSLFQDFAFGLLETWFDRTVSEDFPLGTLVDGEEWQRLLDQAGFLGISAARQDGEGGPVMTVSACGRKLEAEFDVIMPEARPVVVVHDGAIDPSRIEAALAALSPVDEIRLLTLTGQEEENRAAFTALLRDETFAADGGFVWLLPQSLEQERDGDGSLVLQDRVLSLSALALALGDAGVAKPCPIALVLPGGAPLKAGLSARVSHPVNSGLWRFARVLRNEFDLLDLRVVDPGAADNAIEVMLECGLRLLAQPSQNHEWLIEAETGLLCEVRAVPDQCVEPVTAFDAAVIRQRVASQVGSIVWESCPVPDIGAHDVLVKTAATGLNFRDVMWAMGLLPEEALEDGFAGASIGMEFSGEVVAVGSAIDDVAVGDQVMAIAASAFGTHVKVKRAGVTKLPEGIDPVAAATIPVVFLTAYYAIHELARVRPGETILIHGAAGGVGLAAIQIAQHFGAKVIATAGTEEKRRFIKALGVEHVFDSRSLGFVGDVLSVTDGEGVDLALNSLFGEAMEKTLSLVKPFGRFLELGKRDYYADSKIGLRPFRRNVSYFGIDADQLLVLHPDLSRRLLGEVGALFEAGVLTPLPFRAFAYDEIGDAFRLMQNAGHIGKIVVKPPVKGRDMVAKRISGTMKVDPVGMHLVVGGIGGFGLATANWLVEQGARHIALVTRRGVADDETEAMTALWAKQGVHVHIHACDVTNETDLSGLLTALRAVAPLKSVVHAAMVLDDALIANLDRARNRPVIEVKAKGASLLDRLTRQDRLDNFILFSSATTFVGNPGQGNYVAANGFLEGLARARRESGLPGLAIGFGAIADAGYLARNTVVNEKLGRRLGKTALMAREALSAVERYIAADNGTVDAATVMISEFDWALAQSLGVMKESLFEVIARRLGHQIGSGDGNGVDLVALVEGKSPAEGQEALFDVLAGVIADTLRIPKESIGLTSVLKEIGLDSLMAVELGSSFEQSTGFDIPLSSLADKATVGDLTRKLYEKVSLRGRLDDKADDSAAEVRIMEELHRRHGG